MAYTDVLNPKPGFDPKFGDSMCPNYGFERERPSTLVTAKAPGGMPSFRDVANTGHRFNFSFLGRTKKCVQRIRQFSEQFEKGCFTIIDYDNGGRHYVGRFTEIPKVNQAAYSKFDVQGAVFEEMPGMPMLQYPGNWDDDAIDVDVLDDFGTVQPAIGGNNWTTSQLVLQGEDAIVPPTTYENSGAAANDWLQISYRGYGFQLWMQTGPAYGQVEVFLDGQLVQLANEDGSFSNTVDLYNVVAQGPTMVMQQQAVALNLHRVKVHVLGWKNPASASAAVSFVKFRVMR